MPDIRKSDDLVRRIAQLEMALEAQRAQGALGVHWAYDNGTYNLVSGTGWHQIGSGFGGARPGSNGFLIGISCHTGGIASGGDLTYSVQINGPTAIAPDQNYRCARIENASGGYLTVTPARLFPVTGLDDGLYDIDPFARLDGGVPDVVIEGWSIFAIPI